MHTPRLARTSLGAENGLHPSNAQRGEEVVLAINGANFTPDSHLIIDHFIDGQDSFDFVVTGELNLYFDRPANSVLKGRQRRRLWLE